MEKYRSYTEEQISYIKENYCNMTNKEIGNNIGKTDKQVAYIARKLNLVKQPHKEWTCGELKYIKENYTKLTSEEMANHLNRTISSVNKKRGELGLWNTESWSDIDVEYLKDNFMNMTHAEMGKVLNRTEVAIRAKCFDLDLYKKELPWEEWELNYVKENYMNLQTKEIAEYLNRTPNAIKLRAERMGYKKYPYSCDYHYFDIIDTEEKAYWLGFLTADGWISKNEKSGAGVVGIELQYGDIKHLKKFNKSINGNYQITDRWRTCSLSSNPDKKNHICCIRIFSIKMYEDLETLGFTNNKSYDFGIPKLDNRLIRHYIRGYFDGDGCFCLSNKSFGVSFITASLRFKNSLIKVLNDNDFKPKDYSYVSDYNGTLMYKPEFTKNYEKMRFLDWIYSNSSIYLDRKYKKYLKAKEKYDSLNGLTSQE